MKKASQGGFQPTMSRSCPEVYLPKTDSCLKHLIPTVCQKGQKKDQVGFLGEFWALMMG